MNRLFVIAAVQKWLKSHNIQQSDGKNIVTWSADNSTFGHKMIGLIYKEYFTAT